MLWLRCTASRALHPEVDKGLLQYTLVSVAAFNSLHAEPVSGPLGRPTSAQATAITNIINKTLHMWDRLVALGKAPAQAAGQVWRGGSDEAIQPLRADLTDVPICAAQCNPPPRLPLEWRNVVTNPSRMFPSVHSGLQFFQSICGGQRAEYIKIVVAQLKAGNLGLASRVIAGGTVFGRMKANGCTMRIIWHGSAVSQCASRPPLPPHLASPACFAF